MVWDRDDASAEKIIRRGIHLYDEFVAATTPTNSTPRNSTREVPNWMRPPTPWLNINNDVVLFSAPLASGFGLVARDNTSSLISARAGRLLGSTSPLKRRHIPSGKLSSGSRKVIWILLLLSPIVKLLFPI